MLRIHEALDIFMKVIPRPGDGVNVHIGKSECREISGKSQAERTILI